MACSLDRGGIGYTGVVTLHILIVAPLDTSRRTAKVSWDSIYMVARTLGRYVGPRGDTRSVYERGSVCAVRRAHACALVIFLCFKLTDAWVLGCAKGGYM